MFDFLLDFSITDFLKTLIALLVIINPPAALPVYMTLTQGMDNETTKRVYRMVSKSVFCVLAISALAGELILKTFGISLISFQIGGGILLSIIAYKMMTNDDNRKSQTKEEAQESLAKVETKAESISVVPLTIPLLTGPGAMSVCVITASQYHSLVGYLYILISALIIALIVKLVFKSAPQIRQRIGATGMNVMGKVFSLLLMALAIELISSGLIKLFPAWVI